jgi:hypothetical protein
VIGQEFKENFKDFNVKWNINSKKWQKSRQIKILNMKKTILEKIQCISQLDYSFYGGWFFYFNFDITMTYLLSPNFFIFSMWQT